jgi:hypothetical protein
MKNKLKMLFAYFKPLGDVIKTYPALDGSIIEDWDEEFEIDNKKTIEPPQVIIGVIEDLIKLNRNNFYRYNDYDVDTWWYLDITIEPKLNRLTFRSQCKIVTFDESQFENEVSDYPGLDLLLIKAKEEYDDFEKLNFIIKGSWDESEIYDVDIDDISEDESEILYKIGNKIMKKNTSDFWESEWGTLGDITIWGNDVFVNIRDYNTDYEDTEMNLVITPDNIE